MGSLPCCLPEGIHGVAAPLSGSCSLVSENEAFFRMTFTLCPRPQPGTHGLCCLWTSGFPGLLGPAPPGRVRFGPSEPSLPSLPSLLTLDFAFYLSLRTSHSARAFARASETLGLLLPPQCLKPASWLPVLVSHVPVSPDCSQLCCSS